MIYCNNRRLILWISRDTMPVPELRTYAFTLLLRVAMPADLHYRGYYHIELTALRKQLAQLRLRTRTAHDS